MPAPASEFHIPSTDFRSLNHVNLMVDTFIANASIEDLRATVRTLLATSPPSTAVAFTRAARSRLSNANANPLPRSQPLFTSADGEITPSAGLRDVLAHARSHYGAGMGLSSLDVLISVVRVTVGHRWAAAGPTVEALTLVDGEICQAIQSSKEEIDQGRAGDTNGVRATVGELREALQESAADVKRWGGEFPFERAVSTIDVWKI